MSCSERGDLDRQTTHRKLPEGKKEANFQPTGCCDGFLYRWLDPRNPEGARRRIGDIYWEGWNSFVLGFFLSGVGATFVFVGVSCLLLAVDRPRGCAFLIMGSLLSLPGFYSIMVLYFYICGKEGYSYLHLHSD